MGGTPCVLAVSTCSVAGRNSAHAAARRPPLSRQCEPCPPNTCRHTTASWETGRESHLLRLVAAFCTVWLTPSMALITAGDCMRRGGQECWECSDSWGALQPAHPHAAAGRGKACLPFCKPLPKRPAFHWTCQPEHAQHTWEMSWKKENTKGSLSSPNTYLRGRGRGQYALCVLKVKCICFALLSSQLALPTCLHSLCIHTPSTCSYPRTRPCLPSQHAQYLLHAAQHAAPVAPDSLLGALQAGAVHPAHKGLGGFCQVAQRAAQMLGHLGGGGGEHHFWVDQREGDLGAGRGAEGRGQGGEG